jgi:glycine/D-amino acid oxidase-like deaminating enzyme
MFGTPRFKVAVIGAGIAGACARALSVSGCAVHGGRLPAIRRQAGRRRGLVQRVGQEGLIERVMARVSGQRP